MEIDTNGTEAAINSVTAKLETASKKSGFIQAIRRSLSEPAPSIKAIEALAEVQSPSPPPNESVREAEISSNVYKVDDQDCEVPTR
jgi:hypothetical protein